MEEGFEHLRCPMCGGELIYSEGTHDLCCVRNPYESPEARAGKESGKLHEEREDYGTEKSAHINKVWEEGRLRQYAGGSGSIDMRHPLTPPRSGSGDMEQDVDTDRCPCCESDRMLACSHSVHAGERGKEDNGSAGYTAGLHVPDTSVKGHADEPTVYADEVSACAAGDEQVSSAPEKRHGCVFAVSFTESARFGTLWSVRIAH